MMASKSSIPRYLLPQYGAIWRTAAARPAPFARPLSVVRYASTSTSKAKVTAGIKSTTKTTAAAKKVAAPKAASTKASTSKTTAKGTTTKATTTKTTTAKVLATKATATTKASTAKASVTKTTAASSAAAKTSAAVPKSPAPPTPAKAPATPKAAAVPDPSKPLILEKPEKFNPPSHGSRLPRSMPKHYGGGTTFEEAKAQQERTYPGMPPPPSSWAHWFLNNRRIHMLITMVRIAVVQHSAPKTSLLTPYRAH
jgi:glucan-binding YG repeat protein